VLAIRGWPSCCTAVEADALLCSGEMKDSFVAFLTDLAERLSVLQKDDIRVDNEDDLRFVVEYYVYTVSYSYCLFCLAFLAQFCSFCVTN